MHFAINFVFTELKNKTLTDNENIERLAAYTFVKSHKLSLLNKYVTAINIPSFLVLEMKTKLKDHGDLFIEGGELLIGKVKTRKNICF